MQGEKKPARLWPLWCAAVLFSVFVVYPLSMGPCIWLQRRLDHPDWLYWSAEIFYAPADWALARSLEWVQEGFDEYLFGLWGD